jgi:quercetin dioxygenase-like cupin family protein
MKIVITCIAATLLFVVACTKQEKNMSHEEIFPLGNPLPAEWFSGEAFLFPLVGQDKNNEFSAGAVTFKPEARTNWHTHPKGQVLIVTEGEGFYQEKGKPARALKKGDVVNIPENTEHWHGASVNSKFVHIAITNFKAERNVVWLQPVSDQEYNAVAQK